MKKTVAAAEAAVAEAGLRLGAAREAVRQLELEYSAAVAAAERARVEADDLLPQCRLVRVGWHSGKETEICRVVILRKTPSGLLVVRRVGDGTDDQSRFKWNEHSNRFVLAEKRGNFTTDNRELRDVPESFLPAHQLT